MDGLALLAHQALDIAGEVAFPAREVRALVREVRPHVHEFGALVYKVRALVREGRPGQRELAEHAWQFREVSS